MPTDITALQLLYASIPLWPLLAALGIGVMLALRSGREYADWLTVGGVGISAIIAIILFLQFNFAPPTYGDTEHGAHHATVKDFDLAKTAEYVEPFHIMRWFSLGDHPDLSTATTAADGSTTYEYARQWVDLNFTLDGLSAVMMLVVCGISLIVVLYARGYMRDHHGAKEVGYERFFAFLGLFVFSMSMLVMGGNFVLLYLGWELVGLSSYLLIGFYFRKESAAAAAKKAFLVNRIGDLGFALGIFLIYYYIAPYCKAENGVFESPLDYATVFKYAAVLQAEQIWGVSVATWVGLLLLCGALGKSAQFPLYVWLPDAMEGPTPVSALIHAATMVTAGIYLVARCGPIYAVAYQSEPWVFDVILAIGLIGAVLAATMAMAQYDMKRILAYSTMSQLAYMFVGLGVMAPMSAVFHLYTHAFFKALLFLTAGSVMHAMGNIIDLRHFSGLRTVMPTTYRQMLIGCLALAGIPLLAGFWSKDEIVHAAYLRAPWVAWVLIITAGMTAYYTFRMFFLCFNGTTRTPKEAGDHPHDMPKSMTGPLWILAFGGVFAGFLGVTLTFSPSEAFLGFLKPHGQFHHILESSSILGKAHVPGDIWIAYVSGIVAFAGVGLAYLRYGQAPTTDPDQRLLGPIWNVWSNKYWVDEIFAAIFVKPLRAIGSLFFGIDRFLVDGVVYLVSGVPRVTGWLLGFFQRGALQGYALAVAIGVAGILLLWHLAAEPLIAAVGN